MNAIYNKPGYLVVSHSRTGNYILFDWTDFNVTLDDIKQAHARALDVARRNSCHTYIADTSRVANALPPEVIE